MFPYSRGIRRRAWDPFFEIRRLQDDVDRLVGHRGTRRGFETPAVNVYTKDNDAQVTAEVPGFQPGDIDVSVVQNTLTIRGKHGDEPTDGRSYHRRERQTGSFVRSLELPFNVDGESVAAELHDGVLSVTLPRAEEDKVKKIAVKAS